MIKASDGLVPFDEESKRVVSRLSRNDFVICDIKKPRNHRHHRKFFKLLDVVAQSLDTGLSTDDMLLYVKERLGMYRVVAVREKVMKEYESISFGKMSQVEFEEFYDKAVDALIEIAPLDKELVDEIAEFG